ncbi:MAG: hypothetical protein IK088_05970, partial [Lachnospiraceae bacterium]|nr:hypothetical protein [Lachnospiraceae bacterium]
MEGHKGELFRLRLTFWPYYLAAVLTLGLSDVFFGAPYRQCIYALYYRFVREDAMRRTVPGIEKLTDRYLFERPDAETLAEAYGSVPEKVSRLKVLGSKKGFKSVLLRTFGITWRNPEGLADEKERICLREELRTAVPESEGKAYPDLLVGRKPKKESLWLSALSPVSVTELIALFLIFALIGWLWETVYQFLMFGNYVKRGMLYGPWIPIYGVGGGLFLLLFYRFRNRPVRECLLMVLAAGILEYGTAWALFKIYGTMWWDYKGYFLNLNRWICLEGLLAFAVGGLLGVYLAAPSVRRLLEKPKPKVLAIIVAVVITFFFTDVVFSMTHPRTGEYITFDPYDTTMEQRGNDQ